MNNKSILNFSKELEKELSTNYNILDFEIMDIPKSNEIKKGIVFKMDDLSPVFYIDDLYEEYLNNPDIDLIIINMIRNFSIKPKKKELPFDIADFSKVKDLIIPALVNTGRNKQLLLTAPSSVFSTDLRYIYKISLIDNDKSLSVTITYQLMKLWGKSIEYIKSLALSNLYKCKYIIRDSNDVFKKLFSNVTDTKNQQLKTDELYLLSNENIFHGSVHILNKNAIERLKYGFAKDFIILPSSIHEVLVISPTMINQNTIFDLMSLVKEVNNTQVRNCDFLSDYPLIYSINEDKVLDIKDYLELNKMI